MRAFVQHQVAAVVRRRLIVAARTRGRIEMPLVEFVVAGRHQAERVEPAAVGDEKALRLPVAGLRRIDAEVLGPLRHGQIEDGRQAVDLRDSLGTSV